MTELIDKMKLLRQIAEFGREIPKDQVIGVIARQEAVEVEALKQVTSKLNNPDDSLLIADSEACKEQKSKLDLISRAEAIYEIHDFFSELMDELPRTVDEDGEWIITDTKTANTLLVYNKMLCKRVDALPSADRLQTDIVRCGECEHRGADYCYKHSHRVTNNDFCSYGERCYIQYGEGCYTPYGECKE